MEDNFAIQLFEGKKVRIVWDEEQEKYFLGLPQILICGKMRQPPDRALGAKKHNYYICCRGSDLLIMDCRFRRRANKRDRKSVDRRVSIKENRWPETVSGRMKLH